MHVDTAIQYYIEIFKTTRTFNAVSFGAKVF